jgi:hypothetical protein
LLSLVLAVPGDPSSFLLTIKARGRLPFLKNHRISVAFCGSADIVIPIADPWAAAEQLEIRGGKALGAVEFALAALPSVSSTDCRFLSCNTPFLIHTVRTHTCGGITQQPFAGPKPLEHLLSCMAPLALPYADAPSQVLIPNFQSCSRETQDALIPIRPQS